MSTSPNFPMIYRCVFAKNINLFEYRMNSLLRLFPLLSYTVWSSYA